MPLNQSKEWFQKRIAEERGESIDAGGWKDYRAPGDIEEPAFCHDCQHIFGKGEPVKIHLHQGVMLCSSCHTSRHTGAKG
jgi:hypothetical protein